jgi:hypothetical protein
MQNRALPAPAPAQHKLEDAPEGVQHEPLPIDDLIVLQQLTTLQDMPMEHACAGVIHVLQDEIKSRLRHLLAVQQLYLMLLLLLQVPVSGLSQDGCLPAACAAAVCIC